jgi:hypothetical protein
MEDYSPLNYLSSLPPSSSLFLSLSCILNERKKKWNLNEFVEKIEEFCLFLSLSKVSGSLILFFLVFGKVFPEEKSSSFCVYIYIQFPSYFLFLLFFFSASNYLK